MVAENENTNHKNGAENTEPKTPEKYKQKPEHKPFAGLKDAMEKGNLKVKEFTEEEAQKQQVAAESKKTERGKKKGKRLTQLGRGGRYAEDLASPQSVSHKPGLTSDDMKVIEEAVEAGIEKKASAKQLPRARVDSDGRYYKGEGLGESGKKEKYSLSESQEINQLFRWMKDGTVLWHRVSSGQEGSSEKVSRVGEKIVGVDVEKGVVTIAQGKSGEDMQEKVFPLDEYLKLLWKRGWFDDAPKSSDKRNDLDEKKLPSFEKRAKREADPKFQEALDALRKAYEDNYISKQDDEKRKERLRAFLEMKIGQVESHYREQKPEDIWQFLDSELPQNSFYAKMREQLPNARALVESGGQRKKTEKEGKVSSEGVSLEVKEKSQEEKESDFVAWREKLMAAHRRHYAKMNRRKQNAERAAFQERLQRLQEEFLKDDSNDALEYLRNRLANRVPDDIFLALQQDSLETEVQQKERIAEQKKKKRDNEWKLKKRKRGVTDNDFDFDIDDNARNDRELKNRDEQFERDRSYQADKRGREEKERTAEAQSKAEAERLQKIERLKQKIVRVESELEEVEATQKRLHERSKNLEQNWQKMFEGLDIHEVDLGQFEKEKELIDKEVQELEQMAQSFRTELKDLEGIKKAEFKIDEEGRETFNIETDRIERTMKEPAVKKPEEEKGELPKLDSINDFEMLYLVLEDYPALRGGESFTEPLETMIKRIEKFRQRVLGIKVSRPEQNETLDGVIAERKSELMEFLPDSMPALPGKDLKDTVLRLALEEWEERIRASSPKNESEEKKDKAKTQPEGEEKSEEKEEAEKKDSEENKESAEKEKSREKKEKIAAKKILESLKSRLEKVRQSGKKLFERIGAQKTRMMLGGALIQAALRGKKTQGFEVDEFTRQVTQLQKPAPETSGEESVESEGSRIEPLSDSEIDAKDKDTVLQKALADHYMEAIAEDEDEARRMAFENWKDYVLRHGDDPIVQSKYFLVTPAAQAKYGPNGEIEFIKDDLGVPITLMREISQGDKVAWNKIKDKNLRQIYKEDPELGRHIDAVIENVERYVGSEADITNDEAIGHWIVGIAYPAYNKKHQG